jgi:ubiquinone/menaquinone biosynthesis C-methylase UbiE
MNVPVKLERTPTGLVVHSPLEYDLRFLLRSLGRERRFRESLVDLARVEPGESVLDVGCATGSLALAAQRRVGASGAVHGIDPSDAMIATARRKARRAQLDVAFAVGTVQSLPYEDGRFDAISCTFVVHHLPHDDWRPSLLEMRRVLSPGGRLLLVDISTTPDAGRTPHSQGHFDLERLVPLIEDAGFAILARGPLDSPLRHFDSLRHVLAGV